MKIQSDLFDFSSNLATTLHLPEFPSAVRYYDDFDRQYRTLTRPSTDRWDVFLNGKIVELNFEIFDSSYREIIKLSFCDSLNGIATTSVVGFFNVLKNLNEVLINDIFVCAISNSPPEFGRVWSQSFLCKLTRHEGVAVRHILHWLARWEIAHWRRADGDLIRQLPGHEIEKYKTVRDGEAGIDPRVASKVADYLDRLAGDTHLDRYPDRDVLSACVLALCMQHGLRRRQIALLRSEDLICVEGNSLHIRITHIKQRNENVGRTERRRIHEAWVPLFREWQKRSNSAALFGLPGQITNMVRESTLAITGKALSAQAFRHQGAQRLVDGGFSRETVSAYLGHSDVTAANYYFEGAPAQNDLVNAALGKSDVYRAVAAARRGDMITVRELFEMPSDNQIAAIPHGVPITGIGACQSGQSLCTRNPVIACYTCHKFLPLRDPSVHQDVKSKLEAVVNSFSQPSSLQPVSPAMMQLRVTMHAIQNVIDMAADDE